MQLERFWGQVETAGMWQRGERERNWVACEELRNGLHQASLLLSLFWYQFHGWGGIHIGKVVD